MDLVNKAYAQLTELFQAMTVQARVTTALLLVGIGVSLFFLFQYQTAASEEYLFGGRSFSQDEIADMEAAFAQAALNQSQIEGNKIKVPRNQKDAYLAALADASALPENASSHIDAALQSSPFESQAQREARLKHAKEQRVSMVISQMTGIDRAVVTFEREVRPGFRKDVDIRAVAAVKASANQELNEQQIRAIRATVTAFVAGLKKEAVTITDMNGGKAYPGASENGGPTAADNIYAENK
jgi:flagellar M-ring protein FliF